MTLIKLESVGTVMDTYGMTYPMNLDGTADTSMSLHVLDIEAWDWWDNLSTEDIVQIIGVLKRLDVPAHRPHVKTYIER